ncbi:DUF6252 family protein [Flavobacterium ajazii]|uniref:DUF6252 family protein n=1 Tax=Flavobacterium ajazii TaxID=2692318 RepID=UPI0013D72FA8|nr:DUF6252 family protein [Flavobacterium ajazii]
MKKWIFLLSLMGILLSCTAEDVKFNNTAFQTLKNNVFWRAQSYQAYLTQSGNVIIEGSLGFEKVTLQTSSSAEQTFTLGADDISKAYFEDSSSDNAVSFYTGTNIGTGQIVITEFNSESQTISGTFKFTAVNKNEADTENPKISFTEGVFYKVPVIAEEMF